MKLAPISAIVVAILCVGPANTVAGPPDELVEITGHLRRVSDRLASEPELERPRLAQIGMLQVRLNDLKGARKTLAAIVKGAGVRARKMFDPFATRGDFELTSFGDRLAYA